MFECDEYGHIVMDCPHKIPCFRYTCTSPTDQNLKIATIDQPHATVMKRGTEARGLDHNPTLTDTTAKVTMTLTEPVLGHITGTTEDITE